VDDPFGAEAPPNTSLQLTRLTGEKWDLVFVALFL
jgi:hypothetical protein